MHLGAHVLLPEGFDEHPEARYPLVIFHGHFPQTFAASARSRPTRTSSPSTASGSTWPATTGSSRSTPTSSTRTGPARTIPRMVIIEIQHANPYYDDSYAVNSANLGPYGDAITYELIPYLEKKYRCLGRRLGPVPVRRLDRRLGGARGAGVLPDRVQRLLGRLPRPDRLPRLHRGQHLRGQERLLPRGPLAQDQAARACATTWATSAPRSRTSTASSWCSAPRAARASSGTSGRPSTRPVGPDGYPKRIWDKQTGVIDPEVAAYWREHYDLRHILERDWPKIGKKLEGKIHIYVGDMDNYYLNNAVYLMEEFLEKTKDPYYGGEVEVRRPRRALLERRPDPAQRHLPPPLSPDVRPQDRRAAAEDGPAGGGRHELAILRASSAIARTRLTSERTNPGNRP